MKYYFTRGQIGFLYPTEIYERIKYDKEGTYLDVTFFQLINIIFFGKTRFNKYI